MDIDDIKQKALEALSPLKPTDEQTKADNKFLFTAKRTNAGRSLPPYYLVYFLLVELLGFRNLGRFEKIAWSVPVDYKGKAFLIEHRKFGLGIFANNLPDDEADAKEIASLINAAIEVAKPYFSEKADQAADGSNLNVSNKADQLFRRHEFFLEQYLAKREEAKARENERNTTTRGSFTLVKRPAVQLNKEANWLALSAIETFFSWSEHVFILIGVLQGKLTTGKQIRKLTNSDWFSKFNIVFDTSDSEAESYLSELKLIRKQLRNFDAHGSFGKNREAFHFHSAVGAVPLHLPYKQDVDEFKFGRGIEFVEHEAIELIQRFIKFLWSDCRTPAQLYIQVSDLPLILSHATDGTYSQAMSSTKDMEQFIHYLSVQFDNHANMDF